MAGLYGILEQCPSPAVPHISNSPTDFRENVRGRDSAIGKRMAVGEEEETKKKKWYCIFKEILET